MRKRIFFDIETSPNIVLSWRTGYNLNIGPENIVQERAIICICWKWEGKDEVHSLTWDKKQSDKSMLKAFIKELNKANEIVGHNGDRFDLKWLRTRCLFHGVDMFPKYETIDTLKMAKSGFYFNSNKLDYIARFLGIGKKTEHSGLDMWKNIVLHKDESALNEMVTYCKNDVVLLEEVYNKLRVYSPSKFHYGVLNGEEKYTCPECGSSDIRLVKTYTTTMGTIRRSMLCREGCKSAFTISNKTYMNFIQYKLQNNLL